MLYFTPQGVRRPVAISMLTFILALSSRLFIKDELIRSGRWNEKTNYMGWGITGKVVGCIGLGGIARDFVNIVRPLDFVTLAYDPYVSYKEASSIGVQLVDFKTLLRESDFVCVTAPLNDTTYHLIEKKDIELMKPTAFLINVGRGPIIDQKALTLALKENRIRGAALDVFEEEPIDPNDPILKLDNVILTPHAIAWTDQLFKGMWEEDMKGILRLINGDVPEKIINKEVLQRDVFKSKLLRYKSRFR